MKWRNILGHQRIRAICSINCIHYLKLIKASYFHVFKVLFHYSSYLMVFSRSSNLTGDMSQFSIIISSSYVYINFYCNSIQIYMINMDYRYKTFSDDFSLSKKQIYDSTWSMFRGREGQGASRTLCIQIYTRNRLDAGISNCQINPYM